MSYITDSPRFTQTQPNRQDIEEASRKLQDSCRRLQDILRKREEEMRRWEDDMSHFEEEVTRALYEELSAWKKGYNGPISSSSSSSAPSSLVDAWNTYEEKWRNIQSASSGLTFTSIPWPVATPISIPDSLNFHTISQFILSSDHSRIDSPRRRILAALRRWHTDHFDTRVLHKVVEHDRFAVKEGAGKVVRCLNRMLEEETFNDSGFEGFDLV